MSSHRCLPMSSGARAYQLEFRALFRPGQALAFPCDAAGNVDLDTLSHAVRNDYFFARTLIGRDFALPVVVRAASH